MKKIKYLGRTIISMGDLDFEINHVIALTEAAFGKLRSKVLMEACCGKHGGEV